MSIPRLRAALNGQAIAPGDAAYEQARSVFYGDIDRRPAVIVRAADAGDVAQVALRQGDPGVYVNFLGDEGQARVRQAYPRPGRRLMHRLGRLQQPDPYRERT